MENPFLTIAEAAKILKEKGLLRSDNPQTVRKLIDRGEIKTVGDGRLVRIPRESLQAYMSGNPKPVVEADDEQELSEDAKTKIQAAKDAAALAKAQVEQINAEISRDEATRRRDKPEELAKREVAIKAREDDCVKRENGIQEKEVNQANRSIVLDAKAQEISKKMSEADSYYQQKVKEVDEYVAQVKIDADHKGQEVIDKCEEYATGVHTKADEDFNAKKFEIDAMSADLENKKAELSNLEGKVAEAQKQLDAIGKQVKAYLPQVISQATNHYNQARRTSGNTSVYHDNKANQGWDLQREIKYFLKQLGF